MSDVSTKYIPIIQIPDFCVYSKDDQIGTILEFLGVRCYMAKIETISGYFICILHWEGVLSSEHVKPQSHRIVRFCDRTIGYDLVSYDRSAMFAAISFYNRTFWCILYDWL